MAGVRAGGKPKIYKWIKWYQRLKTSLTLYENDKIIATNIKDVKFSDDIYAFIDICGDLFFGGYITDYMALYQKFLNNCHVYDQYNFRLSKSLLMSNVRDIYLCKDSVIILTNENNCYTFGEIFNDNNESQQIKFLQNNIIFIFSRLKAKTIGSLF